MGKILLGGNFVRRKFGSAKVRFGEIFVQLNFRSAKCASAKTPSAKKKIGENSGHSSFMKMNNRRGPKIPPWTLTVKKLLVKTFSLSRIK